MPNKAQVEDLFFQLNEIENEISHQQGMRTIVLNDLIEHMASCKIGDKLFRQQGGFGRNEIAQIVGMHSLWDSSTRTYDVEYEIRKIIKDGALHSMINKVKDSRLGYSIYDWGKYNEGSISTVHPAINERQSFQHEKQE